MRAKIIADIAVTAVGLAVYIWWLKVMPWDVLGAALPQFIASVLATFGTTGLIGLVIVEFIRWIHGGK